MHQIHPLFKMSCCCTTIKAVAVAAAAAVAATAVVLIEDHQLGVTENTYGELKKILDQNLLQCLLRSVVI